MTMTVAELVVSKNIPPNPITLEEAGDPLVFEWISVLRLKIDRIYQRMLSRLAVTKFGPLKNDRLVCVIVSRRPNSCGDASGDYIIDGQHKAVIKYVSETEDPNDETTWLPCQVKTWEEGMTLQEVQAGEAELFRDNNYYRNTPNKVTLYRAGVLFGDKESIQMDTHLKGVKIHIDGFGSDEDDAMEMKTPTPFFHTILNDIGDPETATGFLIVQGGWDLYKKVFSNHLDCKVHGMCFRAMVLLDKFISVGLSNSKQKHFKEWVVADNGGLGDTASPENFVRGFATFSGPQWILHKRVIEPYNELMRTRRKGSETKLGPETLKQARQNGLAEYGEDIFRHPEEEKFPKPKK
tara:strand:+ start:164 stop:1216 length:1053 start_codon:yes stop_codon:yes gene_type:complete